MMQQDGVHPMTTFKAVRFLILAGFVSLVTACKIAVMVVEGGEVQSTASGTCMAGSNCIVEVHDTTFSEAFTAIPNEGWYFHGWNSDDRFLCGGSTNRECTLSFEWYSQENPAVEILVASSETFYLMPIFKEHPIYPRATLGNEPRSIWIDGENQQWLQPKDFTGYTFNQVNAVCPDGACVGSLPGSTFDLTGYTWASIMEVSSLFNAYGLNPPFTGPFQYRSNDPNVNAAIAQDFAVTDSACYGDCPVGHLFVAGMVRDPPPAGGLYTPYFHYIDETLPPRPIDLSFNNTNFENFGEHPDKSGVGVWFWKPAE
jgi:hypothetical protein